MKKDIFIILFLLSTNTFAVDYWLRVSSPTTKWLYKSCFVDSVYGWAAGDSGAIIRTTNGGQNWVQQNSGISFHPIDDIFFTSRTNGWALCNDYLFLGTILLRTSNGGINWTNSRYSDTSRVFNTIYFLDSLTGFLSGYTGDIYKTTNGGSSWNVMRIDTAYCPYLYLFPKRQFSFMNSSTGFVCGGQIDIQGIIWRTTDSGHNWYTYCVTPEPLEDIKVINSSKIMSCGGDYEYGAITAQSHDGGNNWVYDTTGFFGVAKCLAFRIPSELWAPLSFSQHWAVNLDSGSINSPWYLIPAPDSTSVYNAKFLSPTLGWAFGSNGAIMKYNPNVIGIDPNENVVASKHLLFQNYPNPFNPSTIISYYLQKPEFVKITIYDLAGREVKIFTEGIRPAGNNKFKFINSGLATGVYFYKLEAGDFAESKKMVIVK